ncbi:WAT1-related protein At1g25270 isoform X2 [Manihot esculenta]|uniref:WAT1-related protein At1g25270 isoform X2 n=1 Tax=Manihot esculenta TaxID=3983 RepID=UPI001CC4C13D|nr:WAT1-related protein At1g25270 isoform X2 [Manihot esculenta]
MAASTGTGRQMVMKIFKWLHELKPVLLMVLAQFSFAGVNVFYKLATYDGMSLRVIVAYRFIFATVFLTPLALIFERPKLTWTILFQAFLCGFFGGSLSQNFYFESLVLTSATFATAMANLIPAITFILAASFRLEKMGISTLAGKAKVVGTLMGIGGAMLLTFYKGREIHIWSTHINLMKLVTPHGGHVTASDGTRVLGCIFAMGNCISFSLWLIIQAKMSQKFPCPYSSTALMSFMAALQSVVYAFCFEKDWNQWKLGWNIRLYTAAYAGIIVHGMMITLMIWCVRIKGPLFTTIFYPLMLVFTAFFGSLLLDENLHLGSIIGSTFIVCGLYAVLWGKDAEIKKISQLIPLKSSRENETSKNDNAKNLSSGEEEKIEAREV